MKKLILFVLLLLSTIVIIFPLKSITGSGKKNTTNSQNKPKKKLEVHTDKGMLDTKDAFVKMQVSKKNYMKTKLFS